MQTTEVDFKRLIDSYGILRAEMAELFRKEKILRQEFDKLPVGAYEGELFRLAVSDVETERLDMKAVRQKLSPQFISAHTKVVRSRRYLPSARQGNTETPEIVEFTVEAAPGVL